MINFNKKLMIMMKNKKIKYGTLSIALIAIVVAVAVLFNLLVGMANLKWDLTPNQLFSLSDTTKDILSKLDKEVIIYGLFDDEKLANGNEYDIITDLLEQYDKNNQISVQYVDPDKNPAFINELDKMGIQGLQKYEYVVKHEKKLKKLGYEDVIEQKVDYNAGTQSASTRAEQAFTGAIKYVTAAVTPTVYFLEGHEENKVEEQYATLKQYLEYNNYDVKTLNLLTEEKVPEDAEMLIVASPKKDLALVEKDRLSAFLKNAGKAIFMFDAPQNTSDLTNFNTILSRYNIALNYDKVKENDGDRHFPQDPYSIVLDVPENPITGGAGYIVLRDSRSIDVLKNDKEYIVVTPLLATSKQAVGEQTNKERGSDLQGPLNIGVAIEDQGGKGVSKVLVMGNSTFVSDDAYTLYQDYYKNGFNFFFYTMSWLQGKKDEVFIQPKSLDNPRVQITNSQFNTMAIGIVVVLPILILGVGAFVFFRRRHL